MINDTSILIKNIPKTWDAKKIKYVFEERKEFNNPVKTDILISLTHDKGVIPHSEKGSVGNKAKEDLSKYKIVYPGDIVVNSMNVIIGSSGLSDYFGLVSPVYYMLYKKDKNNCDKFFHYLFRSYVFQKSLIGVGNGILEHRMRIPIEKLGDQFIPIPPSEEQKLIAQYLDKKTNQIEMMIEKIQKKIDLLKEQRTTLINQFVTKGLDSSVEMKDSGVEWIGEIPKHWELKKLKHISQVSLSSVDRHEYDDELKVNICHYTDVYKNEYISNDTQLPKGTCSESEFQKFSLVDEDILLTKDSESPDDIGIPTFVKGTFENTVCGYHIAIVRIFSDRIYSEYIYRLIESKSSKDYFFTNSSGITRFGLGKGSIENLAIPIPPLSEQIEIAKYLELRSSTSTAISKKLQKKITLLKDYRQSLISSVITGKVKITKDMV